MDDDILGIVEKSTVPSGENETEYATDEATGIVKKSAHSVERVGNTANKSLNKTVNTVQELRERRHQERYGNAEKIEEFVDDIKPNETSDMKPAKIIIKETGKRSDGKIKQKDTADNKKHKMNKLNLKKKDKIKPKNIDMKPTSDIIQNEIILNRVVSNHFDMGGKGLGDIAKEFLKLLKKLLKMLASSLGIYILPVLLIIIVAFNVYMYLENSFSDVADVIDSVITGDGVSDMYNPDEEINGALSKKFETYNDMYHLYIQDEINACEEDYDVIDTSEVEPDWNRLFKGFLVYVLINNSSDGDAVFQKYMKIAVELDMKVEEIEDKKVLVVKASTLSKDELGEKATGTDFEYENYYSVVDEYIGDISSYAENLEKYKHEIDYREKLKIGNSDSSGDEKEREIVTTEEETERGGGGSF